MHKFSSTVDLTHWSLTVAQFCVEIGKESLSCWHSSRSTHNVFGILREIGNLPVNEKTNSSLTRV